MSPGARVNWQQPDADYWRERAKELERIDEQSRRSVRAFHVGFACALGAFVSGYFLGCWFPL
jgi:hypothetical protein